MLEGAVPGDDTEGACAVLDGVELGEDGIVGAWAVSDGARYASIDNPGPIARAVPCAFLRDFWSNNVPDNEHLWGRKGDFGPTRF